MYLQRSTEYNPICFDLCVENEIDSMNNFDLNQSKLANNETKQKKVADCHDFKMKYKTEVLKNYQKNLNK